MNILIFLIHFHKHLFLIIIFEISVKFLIILNVLRHEFFLILYTQLINLQLFFLLLDQYFLLTYYIFISNLLLLLFYNLKLILFFLIILLNLNNYYYFHLNFIKFKIIKILDIYFSILLIQQF